MIQGEQKKDITKNKLFIYSKKNRNLVITPHMAGLTYESEMLAAKLHFQKLIVFFHLKKIFKENNN